MKHRLKMLIEVTFECDVDDGTDVNDILGGIYDEAIKVRLELDAGEEFDGEVTAFHYTEIEEDVQTDL